MSDMFENLSDVEERDEASPEVKEEIKVRQITQGSTALRSKTTELVRPEFGRVWILDSCKSISPCSSAC